MDEERNSNDPPKPVGIQNLTTDESGAPRKLGAGMRLRNYFLTGLVVAAPVGITAYISWWFITLIDGWVKPLVPEIYNPDHYLPFAVPGVGLLFAVAGLTILGALTANLFGRTIVSYGEMMLHRMPIVRNVYSALKQIFETVLSQSQSSFQQAGLIEYPRKGIWSIVFISTSTKGEILERAPIAGAMLSVFLPTTPNPTSGYLLFVPKEDVIVLDMTVEEAAKLVISAGLVMPDRNGENDPIKQLADRKKAAIERREKEIADREKKSEKAV
jgi:uncharacterized membrane protein